MLRFGEPKPVCHWCGKPAVVVLWRTLYAGTEYEQTSKYAECAECSVKKNEEELAPNLTVRGA